MRWWGGSPKESWTIFAWFPHKCDHCFWVFWLCRGTKRIWASNWAGTLYRYTCRLCNPLVQETPRNG